MVSIYTKRYTRQSAVVVSVASATVIIVKTDAACTAGVPKQRLVKPRKGVV